MKPNTAACWTKKQNKKDKNQLILRNKSFFAVLNVSTNLYMIDR